MPEDCVFCKIIEGELPAYKIYEDEKALAFLDIEPVSKGHTLVIPKKHVENIHEAEEMDFMWDTIVKVANAVKTAFDAEGMNINQNNGEIAGQDVFHMHFHITPRYTGEEIELDYNRSELENGENIAEMVKSEI